MSLFAEDTVFYDRRFLKIGDSIVPIVQVGRKRYRFKEWMVLKGKHIELVFDENYLREWFSKDEFKYAYYQTNDKRHVDFQKWMLDGIDEAIPIDDALLAGNTLECMTTIGGAKLEDVFSESELVYCLCESQTVQIRFKNPEFIELKNIKSEFDLTYGYYVLVSPNEDFIQFVYDEDKLTKKLSLAKKFNTMRIASNYAKKHNSFDTAWIPIFIKPKMYFDSFFVKFGELICPLMVVKTSDPSLSIPVVETSYEVLDNYVDSQYLFTEDELKKMIYSLEPETIKVLRADAPVKEYLINKLKKVYTFEELTNIGVGIHVTYAIGDEIVEDCLYELEQFYEIIDNSPGYIRVKLVNKY